MQVSRRLAEILVMVTITVTIIESCPMVRRIYFVPVEGKKCEDLDIPGAWREGDECVFAICPDLVPYNSTVHDIWCSYTKKPGDCDKNGNDCVGGCTQLDDWGREIAKQRYVTLLRLFQKKYRGYVSSFEGYVRYLKIAAWPADYELHPCKPIVD